jgi:hypothetical protein
MIELNSVYTPSQIPYISYEVLDDYAEAVVNDYAPERLSEPAPIDVLDFIQSYLGLDMEYHNLCYESKVIGFTAFNDGFIRVFDERTSLTGIVPVNAGTVIIDKSLKGKRNIRRFRFTGMHEGSHWLLHKKAFENNNAYGNIGAFEIKYLAAKIGRTDYSRSKLEKTDKDRIERQADFLAAAILMPLSALRVAFRTFFNSIGEKPRVLFRGADCKDEIIIKQLVEYIADIFNVSNRASLIRLEKLRAITDKGGGLYAVMK